MAPHWLVRPESIRWLWRFFIVVLVLTVLADLVVSHHAHFAIEAIFGSRALYGFLACAGLILLAKAIGLVLKRPDTYYEQRERADD